jgi:hypothetical protein
VAAGHGGAAGHPDAELLRVCALCLKLRDAINAAPSEIDGDEHPAWGAYIAAGHRIGELEAQTIDGMVAKARVAMAEATKIDGTELSYDLLPPVSWGWGVMRDVLRVFGGLPGGVA